MGPPTIRSASNSRRDFGRRRGKARASPFFVCALAWILAPLLSACGPRGAADSELLWSAEAEWVKLDDGWARAVRVEGERTLRHGASHDRFRAVAVPVAGEATLTLQAGGPAATRQLAQPEAIDLGLGPEGSLRLASPEGVYLLRPRLVDSKRRGRRVLLVVADTLRFDHATPELMPRVHRYFENGTRYLQAYSPASWTLPAMASVFTGKLPAKLRSPDGVLFSLAPGAVTIASEHAARGWATVAVTANNTLHHQNGFSQGFDLFHVADPRANGFADAGWVSARARAAADWFAGEDLYLYLHFADPHDPYRDHQTGEALPAPQTGEEPSPDEVAALRRAYASEVRHLDGELGQLLAALDPFDLAVFTADHGEELFDHGGFRHGPTLFAEVVHVPLWVRGGGDPSTVAEPVSLVDLKDLVGRGAGARLAAGEAPTMETFSFGPPRWSAVFSDRRVILSSRDVVPRREASPIAGWLLGHHPRISLTTLQGDRPAAPEPWLVERSIRELTRHFAGWRRGLYLLFEGAGRHQLAVRGAEREGMVWGDAGLLEVAAGDGKLAVDVEDPRPFVLLFLPASGSAVPEPVARGAAIAADPAVPGRWTGKGFSAWFDEGRPPGARQEVEETLERLRALGYI